MYYNSDTLQLGYKINGKDYGTAFTVEKCKYRAAISLKQYFFDGRTKLQESTYLEMVATLSTNHLIYNKPDDDTNDYYLVIQENNNIYYQLKQFQML